MGLRLYAQPVCTVTAYNEETGMSQWHITQMLQDKSGMMWFSTWNGIDRFDGYNFVNFKSHSGDKSIMPNDRIRDMRLDANGVICCLADNSWFQFDGKTGQFLPLPLERQREFEGTGNMKGRMSLGFRDDFIRHTDIYGTVWRLDKQGVLSYHDGNGYKEYPVSRSLTDVQFYMTDRQKNLWLLTHSEVLKLTFGRKPFQRLPQERKAAIGAMMIDDWAQYWITTKEDSTVRIFDRDNNLLGYLAPDGRIVKNYTSFSSPIYSITEVIRQGKEPKIYLGSKPGGVWILGPSCTYEGYTVTHIPKEKLPCNNIYNIKADNLGRIWFATMGGGIVCLDENYDIISGFKDVTGKHDLSKSKVRYIHITKDDVLLAATTEGLLVGKIPQGDVRGMKLRLHQREPMRDSSLSNNATMEVLEDGKGRFFICTESGGVNEIVSKDLLSEQLEFRHYGLTNGLGSDVVISMVDDDGTLMLVSSNKLLTLDTKKSVFSYYDSHFFHEPLRFGECRPIRLADGRWLFGLLDGAITIDDALISKTSFVPPIVITAIDISGRGVMQSVNHLTSLVLEPSERSLTISFAALDYSNPEGVSYAYRLSPEDEWTYIGGIHQVSLAGLKPGEYVMELRSTNSEGAWQDNIRRLMIDVRPTFTESTIGRLIILLLLLGVIGSVIYTYRYIRRIKRKQAETLQAYLLLIEQNEKAKETGGAGDVAVTNEDQSTPQPTEQKTAVPELSEDDELLMSRILRYVEDHISDSDANVNDMAAAAAVSRSGLIRKMKGIVGLTPADFLKEARIKRAATMLRNSSVSVADICYSNGFTDPKYFGRCFKATMGVSPSDYRANA